MRGGGCRRASHGMHPSRAGLRPPPGRRAKGEPDRGIEQRVDAESWRERPAAQQPDWPDAAALEGAVAELRALPPLVFAGESRQLRAALAGVAAGRAFLLHVGDCAESFRDLTAPRIRDNLKIMLQMAAVLTYGRRCPW